MNRISIGPINVFAFLFIWQLSLSSLDDHDYSDDILLLLVPKNCHLRTKNEYPHIHIYYHTHTFIQTFVSLSYLKDKKMKGFLCQKRTTFRLHFSNVQLSSTCVIDMCYIISFIFATQICRRYKINLLNFRYPLILCNLWTFLGLIHTHEMTDLRAHILIPTNKLTQRWS